MVAKLKQTTWREFSKMSNIESLIFTRQRTMLMTEEDFKDEILDLKKRLQTVSSENHLLKVKIRKLQTDVDKKNKQIECLLDPKKSSSVRKIISERGASMIINLKQRNEQLEQLIFAKDMYIKKLQSDMQTFKLYTAKEKPSSMKASAKSVDSRCSSLNSYYNENNLNLKTNTRLRSRSLSISPSPTVQPRQCYMKSASDVHLEMDHVRLAQNLQKIRQAHRSRTGRKLTPQSSVLPLPTVNDCCCKSPKSTKSGDCEMQPYVIDMLQEMENMKKTISRLSAEQENTKDILKDKNSHIECLAKQIKHLQKSKSRKSLKSKSSKSSTNLKKKYKSKMDESKKKNKDDTDTYSQESFELDSSCENKTNESDNKSSNCSSRMKLIYIKNILKGKEYRNKNDESTDDDNDVETGD